MGLWLNICLCLRPFPQHPIKIILIILQLALTFNIRGKWLLFIGTLLLFILYTCFSWNKVGSGHDQILWTCIFHEILETAQLIVVSYLIIAKGISICFKLIVHILLRIVEASAVELMWVFMMCNDWWFAIHSCMKIWICMAIEL